MNKYLMLAVFSLTTSVGAFASRCEVQLVDNYGRLLDRIVSNDYEYDCKEGMKTCRLEIRKRGLLGRADCVRVEDQRPAPAPIPQPIPGPRPQPIPSPRPQPRLDAQRFIQNGESVIMKNQYVTVLGAAMNGTYSVQANDIWKTVTHGLRRENLSVTSGCSLDICVSQQVINLNTLQYVTVVGLSYNETLVVKASDIWETITSNIARESLATTEGCVYGYRYQQLCVGNQVIARNNQYSTVVGIQLDGKVVLRGNDIWKTVKAHVDPMDLVITR